MDERESQYVRPSAGGPRVGNGHGRFTERPTGELLKEFIGQGQRLVREELRLAKAELTDEAKKAGKGAGAVGGGSVVLHAGFLVLCFALVFALATVMPAWAAALIVGVVLSAVGAFIAWGGVKRLKTLNPKPEETIETLKEDRQWAKETMHGGRSRMRGTA